MRGRTQLQPPRLRPVIHVLGFVRKELFDLLRQPRLLLVLVAGPFVILLLFAAGYDQESTRLRTIFVGPEDSFYENSIQSYTDEVDRYVEIIEYTSDVVAASDQVTAGDADLIVVFPNDPAETVLEGRQAIITVIHDKLDPLQQTAVEISAQVAVQELNAEVLEALVGEAQEAIEPVDVTLERTVTLAEQVEAVAATGDRTQLDVTAGELRTSIESLRRTTQVSSGVLTSLRNEADPEERAAIDEFDTSLSELDVALETLETSGDEQDVRDSARLVAEAADRLDDNAETLVAIDPEVAVRPFVADTESLLREPPNVNDFFAPSALSLLLQHLAVTLAALTLVRDEHVGLFEVFRVAPISAGQVLAGKYLAFLAIGGFTAAALVTSVVLGIGVPLRGAVGWVVLGLGLLLLASAGLGMLLSALARTDTQAVQYAMLALLAGMFFGGFFLSLDAFRFPIRLISWILPVTYGIRWLQDVMLRGDAPAAADVIGLVVLAVVYGAAAWLAFRRQLAVR